MEFLYVIADHFSQQPSFKYNGKHQFITTFGIILTIILYILLIILGFISGKELWEKKSPSITSSEIYYSNPGKLDLINELFFMVSLEDEKLKPHIDESIYTTILKISRYNEITKEFQIEYVDLTRCSNIINKNSKYYNLVKNLDLYNFYCINTNEKTNNLYINEQWGNKGFVMAALNIKPCYTKDDISNCKNDSYIDEYLKDKILNFYFINNLFDGENYKKPLFPYLDEKFYYPTSLKFTKVTLFFKQIKISNSNNILNVFSKNSIINSFSLDNFVSSTLDSKNREDPIFQLTFQNKNILRVYKREYYSISQWISEIAGIYYLFQIIFSLLVRPYSTSEFYLDLISDLYASVNKTIKRVIKIDNKLNINNNNLIIKKQRYSSDVNDNSKKNILIEIINNENKKMFKNDEHPHFNRNRIYFSDKKKYIKYFSENNVIRLFNKKINISNEINYKYSFFDKFIGLYMKKCYINNKTNLFHLRKIFINEILEIKKYIRRSCYFDKLLEEQGKNDELNKIKINSFVPHFKSGLI